MCFPLTISIKPPRLPAFCFSSDQSNSSSLFIASLVIVMIHDDYYDIDNSFNSLSNPAPSLSIPFNVLMHM